MNPFEKHGIGHLSPSSLNLFIAQPGIWAWRYLARQKEASNERMIRGNAVEAGFVAALRGADWSDALEHAHSVFWVNFCAESPEAIEQGKLIEPMLHQCLTWHDAVFATLRAQETFDLRAAQIKVEHWFDDVPVPVMGYVDLAFDGVDIDLKTTMRCPSKPDNSHVRQVSLYRAARNKPGGLLYVTDKKHAYFGVTDEMMAKGLEEFSDAARRVTKLLGAFEKPDDILAILPIDYDDFRAPKERVDARKAASASDDFEAVELETRA
jgi:hypothetical protein